MNDDNTKLPDWVRPGVSFRQEAGPKDRHIVFHIRGIVDDQAVLRHWRKSKGRWEYECEDWAYFNAFGASLRVLESGESGAE